jgi:hypothetical protein
VFEALRQRLKDAQDFEGGLLKAAVAVANELRQKVREGRREKSRVRRDRRRKLRSNGLSAAETRAKLGAARKASGVSIEAHVSPEGVRLTASDQVQHLRREQAETPDLVKAFAKHMTLGESLRNARGL